MPITSDARRASRASSRVQQPRAPVRYDWGLPESARCTPVTSWPASAARAAATAESTPPDIAASTRSRVIGFERMRHGTHPGPAGTLRAGRRQGAGMQQGPTPPATKVLSDNDFPMPIDNRYFEDYVEGAVYEYGYVTVTEAEILDFARKFDPQPIHVDPEFAAQGPFHGLIASRS